VLNGEKKEAWPVVEDPHTAMAIFAHRPVIAALNVEIKRREMGTFSISSFFNALVCRSVTIK
jgi:hypothetical protein